MSIKHNIKSHDSLETELLNKQNNDVIFSFYKYIKIKKLDNFRDRLYKGLFDFNCKGRIYIAKEGINAQMSAPAENFEEVKNFIHNFKIFSDIEFNVSQISQSISFLKLIVRKRKNIVSDGIEDNTFNVNNTGEYLNAEEFNNIIENSNATIVDVRNWYETEIGYFKNATLIHSNTFREQLGKLTLALKNSKDKPIALYCTGGIRCEKASAWLKHNGFKNVFHMKQGIVGYVREVKARGLINKFKGKNFVFDQRRYEDITEDVLSNCHVCKKIKCSIYTDCKNKFCDMMFISCNLCKRRINGCCSYKCLFFYYLPQKLKKIIYKNNYKKKINNTFYQRKIL